MENGMMDVTILYKTSGKWSRSEFSKLLLRFSVQICEFKKHPQYLCLLDNCSDEQIMQAIDSQKNCKIFHQEIENGTLLSEKFEKLMLSLK